MRKGWEYKKLGDCTQILDSQRKPVTKRDRKSGIYPYYGATGIQDYVDKYIFDGRYVLVGEDGAKWSSFTQSAFIIEGKTWVNNHAHVLRTNDFLVDSFLVYFLNYSDLDSYISGAIIRKLTQASLRNIDIPLPPKSTQLAIVSELDKINELIRLKKEQLKDFDNLAQSLFYEMFGDSVENEKGWEVKKLGDCFSYIKNGANIKQTKDVDGFPITRIETLAGGIFNRDRMGYAGIYDLSKYSAYVLESRDLLMSHINSKTYIGRTVEYKRNNDETIIHGMNLLRLKAIHDIIDSTFFVYYTKSGDFKSKIARIRKDAVNQSSFAISDLKRLNIPLPPLSLQRLFAQRIEQIEREKSEVQKSIQDLETLLASRMQYWFE